ncbi:MAG: LPS export ABC transporter periplasmic protein LptC [Legionella sp.]|jgi:lipopolysaccharide export system protein LptC|nr:LPS export ABC transporter periplasmic protein LptC [Legionella sp.]
MNMSKASTWFFLALLIMAAAAWFFLTESPAALLDTHTLNNTPDHRFTSLEIEQFDALGHRLHALQTPYAHHIPSEQNLWLKTPRIWVTETNQPSWTIQSQEAVILDDGHEVIFKKQVEVEHTAFKNTPAGILKSEQISYFPKTQIAHTPLKITWQQEDNVLEAMGMQADLAEHHVDLLHDARATYRPAHG